FSASILSPTSAVRRPTSMAPVAAACSRNLSGGRKSATQSIASPGPAMKPSSDIALFTTTLPFPVLVSLILSLTAAPAYADTVTIGDSPGHRFVAKARTDRSASALEQRAALSTDTQRAAPSREKEQRGLRRSGSPGRCRVWLPNSRSCEYGADATSA